MQLLIQEVPEFINMPSLLLRRGNVTVMDGQTAAPGAEVVNTLHAKSHSKSKNSLSSPAAGALPSFPSRTGHLLWTA